MLKILRGKEVVSWDQEKLLAEICEKPPLGLRELLVRALILAFPERAGKDTKLSLRIENTLADCAGFYRATAPKNASPDHRPPDLERGDLLYLHPVNLAGDLKKDGLDCMRWLKEPRVHTLPKQYPPPDQRSDFRGGGVDFLNLQNQSWRYPLAGKPLDYRSFPQLYSGAVEAAVDSISPVIAGYLETGIFSIADAARAIGNSGLSITDETGKPCAPDTSDPLPLDKVLEEQAAFRGIA